MEKAFKQVEKEFNKFMKSKELDKAQKMITEFTKDFGDMIPNPLWKELYTMIRELSLEGIKEFNKSRRK